MLKRQPGKRAPDKTKGAEQTAATGRTDREGKRQMMKALKAAPLPVVLVIVSLLCPTELSLYLGGLRLPPHRIALLLLAPVAIYRLLVRRGSKLALFDLGFLAFAVWTVLAYVHHAGWEGFVYGGSVALEAFGGYVVARAYVRSPDDVLATLRVMVVAIAVAALFALPETLFGQLFTHDALRALTGYTHPTGIEQRLGLTRAYGTFDHPIHYATFCAALLAMLWFAERNAARRRKTVALAVGATFLGISSAPMLGLGIQGGLIAWERVTRGIAARRMLTLAILAGLYGGVSLVSSRTPFAIIATGFTLDSWTGFYRLQIWEAGLSNVWAHPLTGLGLADWERPAWMVSSTVDAFWLVVAMRTGIPAVALLLVAIGLLALAVLKGRRRMPDRHLARLGTGWVISLAALVLVGCTVHYWNALTTYFFFFLGLGGVWADPIRMTARTGVTASPKRQQLAPLAMPSPLPPPLPPNLARPTATHPAAPLPPPLPAYAR